MAMGKVSKRQKVNGASVDTAYASHEADDLDHTKKSQHNSLDMSTTPTQARDPRTLFIRHLAPSVTSDDLTYLFSQSYPIKHAVAVLDTATKTCKGYGFVTFTEAGDATRAIQDLNGTELQGKKISVEQATVRSRGDDTQPGTTKASSPHQKNKLPPPKLIVRNLPWSINTPEKLRHLFSSFGKVMDAILPKDPQGKMLGFGIVMIRGRPNNEKALEGMNGKQIDGRTIAVDWAADRETWERVKREEAERNKAEKVEKKADEVNGGSKKQAEEEEEDDTVDQILSKKLQEHLDEDDDAMSLDADDDEDEDVLDEDIDDDIDMKSDDDDEQPTPRRQMTNNDATIFIRNLPFSCVDEDLGEHFEQFGPVRYSRVVYDHQTQQSKGTGFVCFVKKDDAHTCVKEAPRILTNNDFAAGKSRGAGQTLLQDETTDPTGRYTMEGRILMVSQAVDKDEATRLREDGVERRNVRDKDKRKLYLLNEGKLTPKSPLFQKLSPSDIAMRDASAKQRKKLVESNPSLHLSLTRLSVRNVPRSLESKDLKALARQAVVGFASDVKAGERERLSKEELAREAEGMREAERIRKLRGKGIVRQAKVVFENEKGTKVQEAEGAGRSRGYGFIEYYTHRNALMGLRWLNGHQVSYQAMTKKKGDRQSSEDRNRRLIVEFALENVNVINRRRDREHKTAGRHGGAGDDEAEATSTANGTSRRAKRAKKDNHDAAGNDANLTDAANGDAKPSKATKEEEKLAKRTRIIQKKRQARRARKNAS